MFIRERRMQYIRVRKERQQKEFEKHFRRERKETNKGKQLYWRRIAKKINPEQEQKERPLRTENKAIASSLVF